MLDAMNMSGGAQANYFPNSGPGNKTLVAGDSTHGYFGTVTTTEMFTVNDIENFITTLPGTAYAPTDLMWHKFVLDEKFIFVPNRAIRNTTWNSVYNASMVYGLDGNGPFPPAAGGVNQLTQVSKMLNGKTYGFKVRTVKGALTDSANTLSASDGAEFNRLLLSLTNGKFGTLTIASLDLNVYELTQTTYAASTGNCWVRFNTSYAQVNKTGAYNWRPVLELISDGTTLVAAMNVFGRNTYLGELSKGAFLGTAAELAAPTQVNPQQPTIASYPDSGIGTGYYPTLVSASTVVTQSNNWSLARGTATHVTE